MRYSSHPGLNQIRSKTMKIAIFKSICSPKALVGTSTTSTDKIFEKNSSFHVKWRTTGKVQFLFSRSLLLVLTKFSIWEEDWPLGYTSMKF